MAIVGILLINMLIAMVSCQPQALHSKLTSIFLTLTQMGNTYQKIAETRNEWQRQVCDWTKISPFT